MGDVQEKMASNIGADPKGEPTSVPAMVLALVVCFTLIHENSYAIVWR